MSESVINRSESIGALVGALAKAQAELQNPERNRSVTVTPRDTSKRSYSFQYATLDAILDHARPILAKSEIAVMNGVQAVDKWLRVSTMLAHSSGEWVESSVQFLAAVGAQDTGSLITYGRRYTLCGLLGIAAEEDDDSNVASGNSMEDRPKGQDPRKQEPRVERDPIPADVPAWEGQIVRISEKKGEKNGKPWVKYSLVAAEGDSFDTFSESAMKVVRDGGKDAIYQIVYEETKYGKNLVEIRKVEDELPF